MIKITLDDRQLKGLEKALGDSKKQLGKTVARIVNKTAAKHKTQIAKKLREFVKVNAATAKESLSISGKAREPNHLSATVVINQTKRIALNRFGAKQNKKGVRYQISKTEKGFIKGGFIVKSLSGHVFERKNPYVPKGPRDPNRQLTTPKRGTTMWKVYERHKLEKWSQKETAKEMLVQLDVQLKSILKKQGS